jgi:hypothetical protein
LQKLATLSGQLQESETQARLAISAVHIKEVAEEDGEDGVTGSERALESTQYSKAVRVHCSAIRDRLRAATTTISKQRAVIGLTAKKDRASTRLKQQEVSGPLE